MPKTLNVAWNKTKKNVEAVITKYVYYNLSVDSHSTSTINDEFLLEKLESDNQDKYIIIGNDEKKKGWILSIILDFLLIS